MKAKKLAEFVGEIQRGTILRCSGSYPYEAFVDFMLFETVLEGYNTYGLIVVSGYKAGLTFVVFPAEVWQISNRPGLSSEWLRSNWYKWGYGQCPLEDVQLIEPAAPMGLIV